LKEYNEELETENCKNLSVLHFVPIVKRILRSPMFTECIKKNDETFSKMFDCHQNGEKKFKKVKDTDVSLALSILMCKYH
jgi:hypothetical protein